MQKHTSWWSKWISLKTKFHATHESNTIVHHGHHALTCIYPKWNVNRAFLISCSKHSIRMRMETDLLQLVYRIARGLLRVNICLLKLAWVSIDVKWKCLHLEIINIYLRGTRKWKFKWCFSFCCNLCIVFSSFFFLALTRLFTVMTESNSLYIHTFYPHLCVWRSLYPYSICTIS